MNLQIVKISMKLQKAESRKHWHGGDRIPGKKVDGGEQKPKKANINCIRIGFGPVTLMTRRAEIIKSLLHLLLPQQSKRWALNNYGSSNK